MASTSRRRSRDLIAEIKADGPHFAFFQAVRLLAMAAGKGRTEQLPETLRFGTPITLSFPASQIMQVEKRPKIPGRSEETGQTSSAESSKSDPLALLLTVGFMGMTGPSGALPTAYTELLIDRRNHYRDTAAHRFLDLFSHRAISLFYRAWRKYRFFIPYEAGEGDGFSRNLLDFVGVGLTRLQQRLKNANGGIPDIFLIHYSGLLSQKPLAAGNIAALVRGYFGVDAKLEQFVGQWILVPENEQSQLGTQSCVLGESAFAGERIWDRQTKVRIKLGPLTHDQFSDLLPGNPGAAALQELMRFSVGHSLACDVALILRKEEIPDSRLATPHNPNAPMLGYNIWLRSLPAVADADEAQFPMLV